MRKRSMTDDQMTPPTIGLAHAVIEHDGEDIAGVTVPNDNGYMRVREQEHAVYVADLVLYRWEIPSANGYVLPVEAESALGVDGAREVAQRHVVDDRPLTDIERNWIATTEPVVVLPSAAVTLSHEAALRRNAELQGENDVYAAARAAFAELGIDADNPGAWANEREQEWSRATDLADARRDDERRALVDRLMVAQAALSAAIEDTGFGPPKPEEPVEPSYAGLVVVAGMPPEQARATYPRLSGATFVEHDIDAPLTDEEMTGFEILFERKGGIVEEWRVRNAGASEHEPIKAISARLRAMLNVTPRAVPAPAPKPTGPTGIPAARKVTEPGRDNR
jgi:hypothetical protein